MIIFCSLKILVEILSLSIGINKLLVNKNPQNLKLILITKHLISYNKLVVNISCSLMGLILLVLLEIHFF